MLVVASCLGTTVGCGSCSAFVSSADQGDLGDDGLWTMESIPSANGHDKPLSTVTVTRGLLTYPRFAPRTHQAGTVLREP